MISFAQVQNEVAPPYNIKTVSFVQNQQNMIPIFRKGDTFQLQFDDLFGDESNYYYTITHCNYDWTPSQLAKSEYLEGFDNQRIRDYENSFNTLQIYSHYRLSIPNVQTNLRVTGNYIINILNEDQNIVFSRKFVLYDDLVSVPLQMKRSRDLSTIEQKQNLDFAIKSPNLLFQSPLQNVKVLLMQNGQWNNAIYNIKPQYTIGNDLIYKYNTETQFWGGNEFLNFDNKEIRTVNNTVLYVDAKDIYNSHLYTNEARANKIYTYYPDINGNFVLRNMNAANNEVEADYAWVYFSLSAPEYFGKKDIYVSGMFNNYLLTDENKMKYNQEKGLYEKAIMIKQGFTNFKYVISDGKKVDDENAIDGNYYQTENEYFVVVYYRENGERYDRVIGKGVASSQNITN
ncbi:DUF5103 domain-containing protein [Flavobacterium sp. '19STA2R22 D10 B1']|uniref:type IX secretion system plug protein n=1 Tax=Flavobacterium aerium TaxID=3037261 RepID=UPI00278BEB6F|nr:DUF5103 domain-containing protein [Flavobacterium sp. '19STA2R22 D10 B1']